MSILKVHHKRRGAAASADATDATGNEGRRVGCRLMPIRGSRRHPERSSLTPDADVGAVATSPATHPSTVIRVNARRRERGRSPNEPKRGEQ